MKCLNWTRLNIHILPSLCWFSQVLYHCVPHDHSCSTLFSSTHSFFPSSKHFKVSKVHTTSCFFSVYQVKQLQDWDKYFFAFHPLKFYIMSFQVILCSFHSLLLVSFERLLGLGNAVRIREFIQMASHCQNLVPQALPEMPRILLRTNEQLPGPKAKVGEQKSALSPTLKESCSPVLTLRPLPALQLHSFPSGCEALAWEMLT